ncbi:MAG TPA: basic amino acid ABC transporter substrate-binding protein [Fusobacteriaceae bacterium]|nr:basic amino acid ABC transporter substrate-binding protein [Fusobacteriaceae bacterium]
MKKLLILALSIITFTFCLGASKLYVGTNAEYPPFEYLENDTIVGLDADIIEELTKRMGVEYKWSNMSFDGLIPALQMNKLDIVIAGMSVTPQRAKAVNFSVPYLSSEVVFVGRKNNPINSMDELVGKTFGVEIGTTKEASAKKIKDSIVVPFNGNTPALIALKSGKVDAMVVDKSVGDNYITNNEDLMIIGTLAGEPKAIAVGKKYPELLKNVNVALTSMLEDGTISNLKEKYGVK